MISQNTLQIKNEPYNMYPYLAQRHNDLWDQGFHKKLLTEMTTWCVDTFERGNWVYSCGCFYFREEADRNWFMMRFM